ncbi:MAG: hypothetical protein V3U30_02895 [Thermoplasmata archaeon]
MSCPLCGAPFRRDRRHRILEVRRCASCGYRQAAPRGYEKGVTKRCAYAACTRGLHLAGTGRPRLYCSPRCRKAAQRLRKRSVDLAEVT